MTKKTPCTISNQMFSLKCDFSISYGIGWTYQPIWVSVSDLNQNSGFGHTLLGDEIIDLLKQKFLHIFLPQFCGQLIILDRLKAKVLLFLCQNLVERFPSLPPDSDVPGKRHNKFPPVPYVIIWTAQAHSGHFSSSQLMVGPKAFMELNLNLFFTSILNQKPKHCS